MNWRARGVEITDSICGTHVAEIHDEEDRTHCRHREDNVASTVGDSHFVAVRNLRLS
jgi:hypothetical protein